MNRPNLYDYLKIIAITTMITDHVWFYFFPEITILRFIWRIAFPLFLFLVWFSNSYKRRRDIFIRWILIQTISVIIFFKYWIWYVWLNILLGIVLGRSILQIFKKYFSNKIYFLRIITIISFVLNPFTTNIIDYGMLSIIFVIFGYLTRQKNKYYLIYWIIAMSVLFIQNLTNFRFDLKLWEWSITFLWIIYTLMTIVFKLIWQKNTTMKITRNIDKITLFISKNALNIYIIHIAIFSVIYFISKFI